MRARILPLLLSSTLTLLSGAESTLFVATQSLHHPLDPRGAKLKIQGENGWLWLEDKALRRFVRGEIGGDVESRDSYHGAGKETLLKSVAGEIRYYHHRFHASSTHWYELQESRPHLYRFRAVPPPSSLLGCTLALRLSMEAPSRVLVHWGEGLARPATLFLECQAP